MNIAKLLEVAGEILSYLGLDFQLPTPNKARMSLRERIRPGLGIIGPLQCAALRSRFEAAQRILTFSLLGQGRAAPIPDKATPAAHPRSPKRRQQTSVAQPRACIVLGFFWDGGCLN